VGLPLPSDEIEVLEEGLGWEDLQVSGVGRERRTGAGQTECVAWLELTPDLLHVAQWGVGMLSVRGCKLDLKRMHFMPFTKDAQAA
jgi:hypothetical protein